MDALMLLGIIILLTAAVVATIGAYMKRPLLYAVAAAAVVPSAALLSGLTADLRVTAGLFAAALAPATGWWLWQRGVVFYFLHPGGLVDLGGQKFVGKEFCLEVPIIQGNGELRIGESIWPIRGPNVPAGQCVVVIKAWGRFLLVRPVQRGASGAATE